MAIFNRNKTMEISPFLMGKSTISTGQWFNSYVSHYQRVSSLLMIMMLIKQSWCWWIMIMIMRVLPTMMAACCVHDLFCAFFLPVLEAVEAAIASPSQERLEDWEKYLTAVQDVVDVWLKACGVHPWLFPSEMGWTDSHGHFLLWAVTKRPGCW